MSRGSSTPHRQPEANTTYLMEQASAQLERLITAGVARAGHPIRVAHAAVFVNLEGQGIRLTQLAERALMTPQAMGELVDDLVDWGYLKRIPDPTDRRAKLIVLTPAGENALQDAFDTIIELETELERLLGRDGLLRLRRALRRIAELPLPAPAVHNGPAKDTVRRQS